MESWENRIIADKLDSLQDLPDGYTPNLASKWEIIQSGRQGKNERPKLGGWFVGLVGLLLLSIGGMWYSSKNEAPMQSETNNSIKDIPLQLSHASPPSKSDEKQRLIFENKKEQKQKQKIAKPLSDEKELRHQRIEMIPVLPINIPTDSTIKIREDSVKVSAPIVVLKTTKSKRKIFQKDFDGFVPVVDSSHQKTASKGIRIQWLSGSDKGAVSDQPRIRITQHF